MSQKPQDPNELQTPPILAQITSGIVGMGFLFGFGFLFVSKLGAVGFVPTLVLSQLGFGNCLRKRLRLIPFFRSVDVGGWQPWDENGMWSGWKGKNETSWND